MKFANDHADLFLPNRDETETDALGRVTHLAIGAHQDDVEIMAFHGVLECFQQADKAFGAIIVNDGANSPRSGAYANYSDEQMAAVRLQEQRKAAVLGEYAFVAQLGYPSGPIKDSAVTGVAADIKRVLEAARPKVVYTHNLADKHDTHVAVTLRALAAIRELPEEARPERVLGCEVWRNLDWMVDDDKIGLNCSTHPSLFNGLVGVFDSQIAGGKRYDLATVGRYCANATYSAPHDVDECTAMAFAMDLTPLVRDPQADLNEHVQAHIDRLKNDVADRLQRMG